MIFFLIRFLQVVTLKCTFHKNLNLIYIKIRVDIIFRKFLKVLRKSPLKISNSIPLYQMFFTKLVITQKLIEISMFCKNYLIVYALSFKTIANVCKKKFDSLMPLIIL